jgi:hypothetical protein
MTKRILKTTIAAALLCLAAPAASEAGRYHVYSCRMPNGEPAPTDGWSGSLAPGGAFDDYVTNSCAAGGALIAALGDVTTHLAYTDRATWDFNPPSYDSLTGATLRRAGYVHGQSGEEASYEFWLAGPHITNIFEECVYTLSCRSKGETAEGPGEINRVAVPSKYLGSQLYLSVSCGAGIEGSQCGNGFGDPNDYAAALYLYAADLTLEQTAGPTVGSVGGELASAPAVAGTSDLTFTASDPGAGVYEAVFSVDGRVVQVSVPDEAGGSCRSVGQTTDGLPAFLRLQPCPSSVSADVAFDASGLAPGTHHLVVTVLDAAGNSAPVLDRTITVPAPASPPAGGAVGSTPPGAPNGLGATPSAVLTARWRRTARNRLIVAYRRRETIVGRLTNPGGVPISGAEIAVTSTAALPGAKGSALRGVRTRANGAFTVHLPVGLSSRTILLSYTAQSGEPRPTATHALQLAVRAPVRMRIIPRIAASRGRIRFSGRLLAGPIPKGGKPLILEARAGRGAWIEFHVVRTNSRGRFSSSYRFKFPGPARYRFRVVCEQEADYPFAAGSSRAISVRER